MRRMTVQLMERCQSNYRKDDSSADGKMAVKPMEKLCSVDERNAILSMNILQSI